MENFIKAYRDKIEREWQVANSPRWATPEDLEKYGYNCKIVCMPVFLHCSEAFAVKSLEAPTLDLLVEKLKSECDEPYCLFLLKTPSTQTVEGAQGNYRIRYHLLSQEDHEKSLENLVTLGKTNLDPSTFTLKQAFDLNLETVDNLMAVEDDETAINLIGQAVIAAIKREVNVHETHPDQ